ncbi:A/G-specific adenine glycosylase [Patescibacteria group bacterium]|nr:A/G-specific adenine glycosylase [Patescibacteria group bacterium]
MLRELKSFYKKSGRTHLPWRKTRDPYKILVSELMLQQTQVARVIPKYEAFLKRFPTFSALAKASLSDVLKEWQGLGYNRRAKFLHQAAKVVVARSDLAGKFTTEFLESLPGVGPYTARAVSVFSYNRPEVFIETNIRTVFLHHYFRRGRTSPENLGGSASQEKKIADNEILPLIERDLKKSKMEPRDFYAALMDYGSYLKASGVRINNKSKHYVKQSKFEGSTRQKRAALLRDALKRGVSEKKLEKLLR